MKLMRRLTAAQEGLHEFHESISKSLENISSDLAALRQGLVPAVDGDGNDPATDLLTDVTKATTLFVEMVCESWLDVARCSS